MDSPLRSILPPRTIAVVGESRTPDAIGHQIVANLIRYGFTGAVYPVNPRATSIPSVRADSSISDIHDPVDLAVIAVPKEHVLAVAEGRRMVGPNCMGVLNTDPGIAMNATFAPSMPPLLASPNGAVAADGGILLARAGRPQ